MRGAQLHGQVREENEDFAWEIMRKECLRGRGTNCEAVQNPASSREGLARPQSAAFTSLGALAVGLANADPGRLLG